MNKQCGYLSELNGKFYSGDVAFNSVRLWQDTNQDGISQPAELHTFAELGVASINVAGTANNINLGGGNTQTFSGSFTRVGGTTGDAGTAITATAQALPQTQGSGAVCDLRAVSLWTEPVRNSRRLSARKQPLTVIKHLSVSSSQMTR